MSLDPIYISYFPVVLEDIRKKLLGLNPVTFASEVVWLVEFFITAGFGWTYGEHHYPEMIYIGTATMCQSHGYKNWIDNIFLNSRR